MRRTFGTGGVMLLAAAAAASWARAGEGIRPASLVQRYGIEVDLEHYPQGDPQQTIRSVVKATKAGRIEYMLAHLISPKQVDEKLQGDVRAMKALATKATPEKSAKLVAALERQLAEGTWTIQGNLAWARRAGLPDLSLEKIGGHWFMHNTPVPQPSPPASSETRPAGGPQLR